MKKCENCGGEGLIHQGESIKYTCSVCMGTGKDDTIEIGGERDQPEVTNPLPEVAEESVLTDSSDGSGDPSEDVV